jgi:hypothetical protein
VFALSIISISTFFDEVSASIGKKSMQQNKQNVYQLGFLTCFWSLILMSVLVLLGANIRFNPKSIPFLASNIALFISFNLIAGRAIKIANRSSIGLIRPITIPLLLLVDLAIGYKLTSLQIAGTFIVFLTLISAIRDKQSSRKGSGLIFVSSVLSVGMASISKYDITYFNSVAVDQSIVMGCSLAFFSLACFVQGSNPFRLLSKPRNNTQSMTAGLSGVLEGFAYLYAPASVVVSLKRGTALIWSTISGKIYFKEENLIQKLVPIMATSLALYLFAVS